MQISVADLAYSYDHGTPFERQVLQSLSLTIQAGTWTAIAGKTGSGKSTFVQLLKGLILPRSGQVCVGQHINTAATPPKRAIIHEVGIVFQNPEQQFFSQTIHQELCFGPEALGWTKSITTQAVQRVCEQLKIAPDWLERSPFTLSGGQQRRVALASILVMNPDILILDEPTTGLDPQSKATVLAGLKTWQQLGKKTVMIISHNMDLLADYADEVIVFQQGAVVLQETPLHLFQRPLEELQAFGLTYPTAVAFMHKLNRRLQHPLPISSVKQEDIINQIKMHMLQQVI